ncbi:hypothetical protein [Formosa haliotis]|uniref:hypothetical protein n=1 Tax=Formosa haliotis TaxID=1555194 RepID=UPI000825EF06|nr:hypothetical protein [Formosa haliotis]
MKLKFILPVIVFALFMTSCSSDDDNTSDIIDEIGDLKKIQDIETDGYTLELYNAAGKFETGYNDVTVRIKDESTDMYIENYTITSWMPKMDMGTMEHACPHSNFENTENTNTLKHAMVIYQMTFEDGSGWSLDFDIMINDISYNLSSPITVTQSELKNVTTFTGADETKYILAYIAPQDPIIGSNDLNLGLYKMESMMSFPIVKDYSITLDPRMPSMGNHSSPNNEDLTYTSDNMMYQGKLNLTMSGYWVLNLQLYDTFGNLLKGETITDDHEESSLNLEIEF